MPPSSQSWPSSPCPWTSSSTSRTPTAIVAGGLGSCPPAFQAMVSSPSSLAAGTPLSAPSTPSDPTPIGLPFEVSDEGLCCLMLLFPTADVELLKFLLSEASGDVSVAEASFRRSLQAEQGDVGHDCSIGSMQPPLQLTPVPSAPASPPSPAILPLPIPLSGLVHLSMDDDNSPSWDGWGDTPLTDDTVAAEAENLGHLGYHNYQHSSGFTTNTNACNTGVAGTDSPGLMWQWEEQQAAAVTATPTPAPLLPSNTYKQPSSFAAQLPPVPLPQQQLRLQARRGEAERRAANEAFVEGRRRIQELEQEALACRQMAIDARRMNRLQEGIQYERQAKEFSAAAAAAKQHAARTAFRRNNPHVHRLPEVDLHNQTVGEGMRVAARMVANAQKFVDDGIYPGVEVPIITGRGVHSMDRVAKIRDAVEAYLQQECIRYTRENGGGMVVAHLGAAATNAAI